MSTPQEIMYHDSVGAMRASLSSSTSKENRSLVDAYLSRLKEDRQCLEIMMHVLTVESENHDDFIRMMSLTILNDWLKIWWNKILENEQAAIRNTVVMLVKGTVGKSPVKGLWTKLAVMISNIAIRQFPQQWPTFLEDMVSLCNLGTVDPSSFGEQEIAIMAIEYLASDSIDTDYCNSLPLERRQDILAGFRSKLPQLLGFAYTYVLDCSNRCATLPPKGSSGVENDNLRAHLTRLNAGLMRMMIPIAMFAKAEDLCDCKANRDFSIVAVQFLCDPELQGDAVDLLLIITRHKLPFDVFSRLVETIPRLSSSLLQPTPPATAGGSSLPADILECLTFQRTYAEMVFSLLCENISQATDRFYLQSIPNAQEILGNYVMLMANLIGQSSRRLAGDVAKEWTKIFREDSIANIPWMSDVCVVLLNVYTSKMERIIWEKEIVTCGDLEIMNITPLDETAAAEFNDYDEWMDFAGALKTQVKNLCSVLAVKFPKVCVSFLETRCRYLISRPSMAVKGDPNDAEDVMQWQAFGIILEALSSKLVPSDTSISNEINVQVMGQLYVIIDLLLSWTPPSHSVLLLQRLQCFHNCSAVLRSAPKEIIQRVFADLFGHDSLILSTAPLSVSTSIVTPAQLSEKASAVIAHLCHYCGEAVTLDSTLLNAIVSQIMKMISMRTQQRPIDQLSLQSLQNQRGCLRESLVALSERLTHTPVQQKELLVMSLADVVGKWQEVVPAGKGGEVILGVFLSSQTLLDACFINDEAISISKDTMGVVLSSSKRVTCASLPDAVWAVENHQAQISAAQYASALDKALPYFAVWQAVMPGVRIALKTLHGTLDPTLRQKFAATNSIGLYYPPASLVRRAAGLPSISSSQDECEGIKCSVSIPGVSEGIIAVSKHLGELRVLLYQLLGQACSHKALYACAEHATIIRELGSILPWLENNQLSQLMKTFVESFVLNAPPVVFDVVAGFLEIFLTTTFRRLAVCWERSEGQQEIGGQEASMYKHIYRDCSIPQAFSGLDVNVLENAKVTIFSELTRTYGDTLASFACCRGFLALDMPTSAALQSAAMLGISTTSDEFQGSSKGSLQGASSGGRGKKGSGKSIKSNLKHLDAIPESELNPVSADSETRLKQHKALRRKALSSLLMGNPRYQQAVTAPFVASAVTLIGLPDTTACRRGILIGEHLASESRTDKRLLAAVGKDAFSAALSVLLQQEAWSDGLESDVIEFLASVYGVLVLGETLAPDGSILTPALSNSTGSAQGQVPGAGQKAGPGFGSMSQWQGGKQKGTHSGKGSDRDINTVNSSGQKKETQPESGAVLSDFPRRVLLMVASISAAQVEALERQMLATMSKKKRRDHFRDMLKAAGVGSGSAGLRTGKRIDSAVIDIRQRINRHEVPRKPKDVGSTFFDLRHGHALEGSENDLNLSLFFGE